MDVVDGCWGEIGGWRARLRVDTRDSIDKGVLMMMVVLLMDGVLLRRGFYCLSVCLFVEGVRAFCRRVYVRYVRYVSRM